MPDQPPAYCDFCFNSNVPLYEGGVDTPTRICGFCASQAVAQTTPQPQPVPEPTPPPEPLSKEVRLAFIPSPKTLVAHLDQNVVGQTVAKRRLALGVSNHFKRVVDTWARDAPTPSSLTPIRTMCESRRATARRPLWLPTSTSPSPSGMPPL
jgi:ATP-dependent protease Clp ATPase subunit